MNLRPIVALATLSLLASSAAARPLASPARLPFVQPAQAAELRAHHDVLLDGLRAGRVEAPTCLSAAERSELQAARACSQDLLELRAGDGPTEHEWTMIAIGAAVVLLIILI